jgi:BspA type Leucine rich repeat region (6 copies)/IPT/TIG domain/Putative Ig domain
VAGVLTAVLSAALLSAVAAPAAAAVSTATVDGYEFAYVSGNVAAGATVTGYVGSGTVLTIPGTLTIGAQNYSVTGIGAVAFDSKSLTSVTIPNSVTTIGEGAFANNKLTSVTIPTSVTTISDGAFNSNLLTSVTIPTSVTAIYSWAFAENPLDSVVMLGPVPTTIGTQPFGAAGATKSLVTFYSSFASSGYTTPKWTAGGQAYASQALAAPLPVVSGVSPSSGSTVGGTSVTLTGSSFTGATSVTFDGVAGTALSVGSDSSLTVTTPAHAAGEVSVVVTTPGGSSLAAMFTYVAPVLAPSITTGTLPAATVGTPYSATVTATGTAPITFTSSGALPGGLVLDPSTGVVSGTPTSVGSATFTVTATNSAGTDFKSYTVAVAAITKTAAAPVLASTGFDVLPWGVGGVLTLLVGAMLLVLEAKYRRSHAA